MMATDTELTHFMAVYRSQNFTRAAVDLSVTQSALTQSILRLEHKLAISLFIRTKKGCLPTHPADVLFEKATKLKEYWNEIEATLADTKNKLQGKFRVGCHPSVGAYTLSKIFRTLNEKAPDIRLELVHDMSREIVEKVLKLEVDLALVINPQKHPDLIMHKLGTDQIFFWKGHEKDIPHIVFSDMPEYELKKKLKGKIKVLENHQFVETKSLELIRSMVSQGAGIGLLPERVAKLEGDLKKMGNLPSIADTIQLVYRYDTLKSSAAKLLIEVAKACL